MNNQNRLLLELLRGITENELKELVNLRKSLKPVAAPATKNSVKQMVQKYEENIIPTPLKYQNGYKPIRKPRTKIT